MVIGAEKYLVVSDSKQSSSLKDKEWSNRNGNRVDEEKTGPGLT